MKTKDADLSRNVPNSATANGRSDVGYRELDVVVSAKVTREQLNSDAVIEDLRIEPVAKGSHRSWKCRRLSRQSAPMLDSKCEGGEAARQCRSMWDVLPRKFGGALGALVRLAQLTIETLFCPIKARRKEREGDGAQGDPKLYLEETLLERKLPDVDMRQVVELPDGLDYNEWLASHTLALFDHVNLIYGTVSEFCTPASCSDMTGPGGRAYPWFDEKGKKTKVAAPQYIDYVMTFTQKTVSDENIFPTKYANEFPSSFESIVRKIVRLLFHVVAHLYAAHFREVALLRLHAHLNLTFAHLTALHRRFGLIEPKETEVLRDLELALRLTEEPTIAVPGSGAVSDGGGAEGHSPPPAPGEPPPPAEPPRPSEPPSA